MELIRGFKKFTEVERAFAAEKHRQIKAELSLVPAELPATVISPQWESSLPLRNFYAPDLSHLPPIEMMTIVSKNRAPYQYPKYRRNSAQRISYFRKIRS